jgi:hypothetical protein
LTEQDEEKTRNSGHKGSGPGDITPEHWATSNRNGGRHRTGMLEGSTRPRDAGGNERSGAGRR